MKNLTDKKEQVTSLYNEDFQEWLSETISLLQKQEFDTLDIEHLIEELTDLGKAERNAVENLLDQVIRHLLLFQYWLNEAEYNANHWKSEIYTFRIQIKRKLTTNLRKHLELNLDSIYKDALGFVKIKTENTIHFPIECPYSIAPIIRSRMVAGDH